MADVQLVKSKYTGADVTSLGEVTAADNAKLPGTLEVSGAKLTGGTNTFNITNGTASLDVAAGVAVNVDAELHITAATHLNEAVSMSEKAPYTALPNRNVIINGAMDIWQRGTATLTNPAAGTYFSDRFKNGHILGDSTYNMIACAETPVAGFPFNYSLQVDCTHIETEVAAGEVAHLRYNVEGYSFKNLTGQTATLSFWVKATKTGIYCVAFMNIDSNKSYISEYTVNASNTWERKTVTLTFNAGGTWAYNSGIGLKLFWSIMCGSTYQTAANAWQDGNYLATSNQVNVLDSTNNNFWLTGVQLELGAVATPFEVRTYAQELALCQRYYETFTTAPTATYSTSVALATTSCIEKRVAGTCALITAGNLVGNAQSVAVDTITNVVAGTNRLYFDINRTAADLVTGHTYIWRDGLISISAEL
jgi:hypothetical protein